MIVNLTVKWSKAPAAGHIGIDVGQVANALIVNGTGSLDLQTRRFEFSSTDRLCELAIAVEVEEGQPAVFFVDETDKPIRANVEDALIRELAFDAHGASLAAEVDMWASL